MHTYVNFFAGVLLAVRDIAVPGVQGWTRHCQQWSLLGTKGSPGSIREPHHGQQLSERPQTGYVPWNDARVAHTDQASSTCSFPMTRHIPTKRQQGYFTVTVLIMAHFVHSEHLYWSGNQSHPQSSSLLEPENISPGKYQCHLRPLWSSLLATNTCECLKFTQFFVTWNRQQTVNYFVGEKSFQLEIPYLKKFGTLIIYVEWRRRQNF